MKTSLLTTNLMYYRPFLYWETSVQTC